MNASEVDTFASLYDALRYVGLTSGLHINETLTVPQLKSKWSSTINVLPLVLGFIGLIFNILSLLIFSTSKTFRKTSFRYYIYAFVLINCASVFTHSWLYLIFYLVDPMHFCKYLQYFQQSTATTSLWIMVLLTLERSLTFSLPFTIKRLLQSHTICILLSLVIILCFVLHIDEIVSVDVKAFRWVNFAYGICSVKRHFHLLTERIKIITHANSFILPFVFNSILDVYICYKICQRRKLLIVRLSSLSASTTINNHNKKIHHRSKKSLAHEITLTLLCQSMWLLFTYFPMHLYYFLISFNLINDHDRDNSTFNFLMRQNLLIYLAFSPALYVILSPTLRKEISTHLFQSYQRHRIISSVVKINRTSNIRNTLVTTYHQHTRSVQQTNLSFSIAKCKQIREKVLLKSMPVSFKVDHESRSAPCLVIYNNQYELNQHKKIERSNTLRQ